MTDQHRIASTALVTHPSATNPEALHLAAGWTVEDNIANHYSTDPATRRGVCRACGSDFEADHRSDCWWDSARRLKTTPLEILLPGDSLAWLPQAVAAAVAAATGAPVARVNAPTARALLKRQARQKRNHLRS